MSPLDYPDRHHLNAAAGWLALGDIAEARGELARISTQNAGHPEVLNLQWHVHAEAHEWEEALLIAQRHISLDGNSPSAWIHQSFALHELQRTREAYHELQRVVEKFPADGTIPYNLACYTCRLGRLSEARDWLARARGVLGRETLLAMASEDPDLEQLRKELKEL